MATNDFITAIAQLSAEKNLDQTTVFEAVEVAMASALKKDDLQYAEIEVKIDAESGEIRAWRLYTVMDDDDIEDDEIQVSPERAAEMGSPGAAAGDVIRESLDETPSTGRIAAQTAKQVVLQRLREAERESVFGEYTGKEGELVSGAVLRVEGGHRQVIIDLGRTEALLPAAEQVRPEHYRVGQRLRVYVKEVYRASKGPQVIVSRSHPELLKRLFELEVPEVARGIVEIMGIARDPGYRTKVAVISRQPGVDPIGACVGVRGARIQNIVNELNGERIDLVRWDPNELAYLANALSPAEVVSVRLEEETNTAYLAVPEKQLSLAIGKEGQNARLAAKLTGRRIDIQSESVLITTGADLYPPPEPNMEAVPLAETPALPTIPLPTAPVAPSQADYARPGLPGEAPPPAAEPPAPEEEAPVLTPEQEIVAEFEEKDEPPVEEEEARPAASVERPAPARAPGGLRFAEDIRGLRSLEVQDETPAPARRRRRGRRAPPAQERPPVQRRASRHFEVEDEEIEEGLSELHAEDQVAEDQVVEDQAAEDQVAEDQVAEDQVAEDQVAEDQVAEDQAAEDQAAEDQAAEDQANEDQAIEDQAIEDQPADDADTLEEGASPEREEEA